MTREPDDPHPIDPRELLPLGELSFQILLSLGAGPAHGYGLGTEIAARTEGRIDPTTGSLYQALRRLGRDGLIENAPEVERRSTDGRRRYYRLTELGREAAAAEADRLAHLLDLARCRNLWDRGLGGAS